MGQHFSNLRKTRAAGKDAQCIDAINRSIEPFVPLKDECATSSLNETEDVRSSFTKTSIEVSHTIRDLKTDLTPVTILKLPTELVLDLANYLRPSAYMSLSYSCRRVYKQMSASFAHVLGDKVPMGQLSVSVTSAKLRNYRFLERLILRSLLDRDGKIPSSEIFCNGCSDTHDSSQFSLTSLAQPSMERQCLGRAGRMWICPHQILDYHQLDWATRSFHTCESCHISISSGYSEYGFASCITGWPIMGVPRNSLPSNEEVKEALGRLSAPMCPHLSLNDACVASVYDQHCRRLRWDLASRERDPVAECQCFLCSSGKLFGIVCELCGTEIRFGVQGRRNNTEILSISMWRTIGRDVLRCTDREWICQVAEPADFEEYEREWQASNAECQRRVLSDQNVYI